VVTAAIFADLDWRGKRGRFACAECKEIRNETLRTATETVALPIPRSKFHRGNLPCRLVARSFLEWAPGVEAKLKKPNTPDEKFFGRGEVGREIHGARSCLLNRRRRREEFLIYFESRYLDSCKDNGAGFGLLNLQPRNTRIFTNTNSIRVNS
jgi:hypothetical protein